MTAKRTIDDARDLASEKGGKCLSEEYINAERSLLWECEKGHQWEASFTAIRLGRWCKRCFFDSRMNTIEDAQQLALKRGGCCLSTEYLGNSKKLIWECGEGHVWETSYNNVQQGSWCPICAESRAVRKAKLTINDARKLASDRGGKCLSAEYKNVDSKLRWQCNRGHVWEATYSNVSRGTWCRRCFWDGRMKTIKDAQYLAEEKGGKCLSTKYKGSHGRLLWECSQGHQWEATYSSVQQGYWCPKCAEAYNKPRITIDDARSIAAERGGECLSTEYKNIDSKLQWECNRGHVWEATYSNVSRGTWCRKCVSENRMKTIKDAQDLAQKRGGKCLSTKYKGFHGELLWQCERGHKWKAKYRNVQQGHWCPECGYKRK